MPETTYKIAGQLIGRLRDHVKNDPNYGTRKKSRWICEAICQMREEDKRLSYLGVGSEIEVFDSVDKVSITSEAQEAIADIIRRIRTEDPLTEGIQSDIIRSAILYRLRKDNKVRSED